MKVTHKIICVLSLCIIIPTGAFAAKGGNSAGNSELENRIAALEALVISLQSQITNNDTDIADHQSKLQFVSIIEGPLNAVNGPHFLIEGANVHVRSGAGSTSEGCSFFDYDCVTRTGLGNLIVGYNELREPSFPEITPEDCASNPYLRDDDGVSACDRRNGAHSLVVGAQNNFTGYAGLVAGATNEVEGSHATVTGGRRNSSRAQYASVSGGLFNSAAGSHSSVTGGGVNNAFGYASTVSGGSFNTTWGGSSSISGGFDNRTFAEDSSISGGEDNTTDSGAYSASISGGRSNFAVGRWSSITGGNLRTATPEFCVVGESGVDCPIP